MSMLIDEHRKLRQLGAGNEDGDPVELYVQLLACIMVCAY